MNFRIVALVAAGFILGASASAGLLHFFQGSSASTEPNELHLGAAEFVNPLLDCPAASSVRPARQAELEEEVQELIDRKKSEGDVDEVSVYFRDMNNGPSFGINTSLHFSTASLLKVPVMISYFKRLEVRPGLFDERIVYDKGKHDIPNLTQTMDPPEPLLPGQAYPVSNLVHRMIAVSDNIAASMLLNYMTDLDVIKTLKEMGVKMILKDDDMWITVRDYASIFRILFNATYLGKASSNRALEMLSKSRMTAGLPAGVSSEVVVAHKFGERTINGKSQFHDCGVVYYPGRPYLVCVMTRGRAYPPLVKTVAEISKMVFAKVSQKNW